MDTPNPSPSEKPPYKPPEKTGDFARIKPLKREELGKILTQEIPLNLPNDFFQLYPIDAKNGEGIVYVTKVLLPSEQEEKTYVVLSSIVEAARDQCAAGDTTFSVLTPVDADLGGDVREYEMHPWVDRSKRFGFWPVAVGLKDNAMSQAHHYVKQQSIEESQGCWVRKTKSNIFIAAPAGTVFSPPSWPKELLNGGLTALIHRAYKGRVITSLESSEARWKAGLDSI